MPNYIIITILVTVVSVVVALFYVRGVLPNNDNQIIMDITLDAATEVDIPQIDAASPLYDLDQSRLDIIFTNRGSSTVAFPAEAIMHRVIRRYTDINTQKVQSFNINEPPVSKADLVRLVPGESWRYGVGLEMPNELLRNDTPVTKVQVCVTWDKSELDIRLFPIGSYDWAESFSVCHDLVIRQ